MVGDNFNCFRSLSAEFSYHAFIIYSQSDCDWVSRKLLPLLEEKHGLKCCVHYRDFTPGKPFQDSMAESVYNSYKIIAVLSSNFLNSNYCSYELNIAKYRLLNRRDESLVVIRIDNEDCRKLPKELRKRNFIDYSNALERPLWEHKLIRFLNIPEDFRLKREETVEQDYSDDNSGNSVLANTGSSSRNEGHEFKIGTNTEIVSQSPAIIFPHSQSNGSLIEERETVL